jgi:threonylcarbamoyladenosine tRNA methylthiotransferase MtaB
MARNNPEARLVLTGCYSQRFREDLLKNPQVWQVFRNEDKADLPERILDCLGSRRATDVKPFRSRALVKIQDGCDFRCSFCIIPEVRGQSVSLSEQSIMAQVKDFVRQGYNEIVLTGIHLCSYGRDRAGEESLIGLLRRLENTEGLQQVRLSSLDPRFLDREFCDAITRSPVVCPHFHLSLQHGSDDVIRRMGRKIKVSEYKRILDDLRENSPDAALGADLIVGFPGETDQDFENMCDFLESSPLTYFHVFSYSPRPGTAASRWEQVDERVKKGRASRLRKLAERKNLDFRKKMAGNVFKGVVIKRKNGGATVLTSNFVQVHVSDCAADVRDLVKVEIVDARKDGNQGMIVV